MMHPLELYAQCVVALWGTSLMYRSAQVKGIRKQDPCEYRPRERTQKSRLQQARQRHQPKLTSLQCSLSSTLRLAFNTKEPERDGQVPQAQTLLVCPCRPLASHHDRIDVLKWDFMNLLQVLFKSDFLMEDRSGRRFSQN